MALKNQLKWIFKLKVGSHYAVWASLLHNTGGYMDYTSHECYPKTELVHISQYLEGLSDERRAYYDEQLNDIEVKTINYLK